MEGQHQLGLLFYFLWKIQQPIQFFLRQSLPFPWKIFHSIFMLMMIFFCEKKSLKISPKTLHSLISLLFPTPNIFLIIIIPTRTKAAHNHHQFSKYLCKFLPDTLDSDAPPFPPSNKSCKFFNYSQSHRHNGIDM